MMPHRVKVIGRRRIWRLLIILAVLLVIGGASSAIAVRRWYLAGLGPVSTSTEKVVVTIPIGSTMKDITAILNEKQLLKNPRAFEWYIRTHELRDELKAGTYRFSKNVTAEEIIASLVKGEVAKDLFTILPAQRLDQLKDAFGKAGFSKELIDEGMDIKTHAQHPVFADGQLPATLEGYLYPESFQRVSTTTVAEIVNASLNEMQKQLTPARKSAFAKQGLSTQQAVTLASIIEKEVNTAQDRKQVAQVFLRRLDEGIALGSDVTFMYAAAIAGKQPTVDFDSPYNTRIHTGLPPGPINNVSDSSLEAVANPAPGDYLFFVTGDDGTTYFSHTQAEHEQYARQYCKKLCEL